MADVETLADALAAHTLESTGVRRPRKPRDCSRLDRARRRQDSPVTKPTSPFLQDKSWLVNAASFDSNDVIRQQGLVRSSNYHQGMKGIVKVVNKTNEKADKEAEKAEKEADIADMQAEPPVLLKSGTFSIRNVHRDKSAAEDALLIGGGAASARLVEASLEQVADNAYFASPWDSDDLQQVYEIELKSDDAQMAMFLIQLHLKALKIIRAMCCASDARMDQLSAFDPASLAANVQHLWSYRLSIHELKKARKTDADNTKRTGRVTSAAQARAARARARTRARAQQPASAPASAPRERLLSASAPPTRSA